MHSLQNHTHRTSINIRFNQFKDNIRDFDDDKIEETRHMIEQLDARAPTEEPEKVILATGEGVEYLTYMDNDTDAVTDSDYHYYSEFDESASIVKKALHQKPALRRIEGRNVFYISAIADDLPTVYTSGK